jgi:hypothetical protein
MHMSRRRSHRVPSLQRDRAGRAGQAVAVGAVVACALLACLASTAQARDDGAPLQLTISVVAPSGIPGPRPTGAVRVIFDGRPLVSLVLEDGLAALTSITPQLTVELKALGHRLTISYSGDSNYAASSGLSVTIPTRAVLTIVARPRDTVAPGIEILSPRDGARYARGEAVVASYSCHDPGGRSAVTACDGPVASERALDTTSLGRFAFAVTTEDALGNAALKTVTYDVVEAGDPTRSAPDYTAPDLGASGGGSHGSPASPPGAPVVGSTLMAPAVGAPAPPAPPMRGASAFGQRAGSTRPGSGAGAQLPTAPSAGSSNRLEASSLAPQLVPYDPRSDPVKTLGILVAAFTLLQFGTRTGGLALARGAGGVVRPATQTDSGGHRRRERPDTSEPKPAFGYVWLWVRFLGAGLGTVAVGDRSRTWTWPGTRRLDALSATLPTRLARRSPLLARVAADGTYLRAILGSASLLGLLAGLALGIAAIRDTGGDAVPPAAVLTIAIAVLGVLDATAGLVAVLVFMTGVVTLGGVDSSTDLRVTFSLSALWFVVPVLAGAIRPLRRPPTRSIEEAWERAADFVIASLVGAWTVYHIVLALPGLAGMRLPIAEYADTAAFCVLAALVVRLSAETIASHLYPRRLDVSEPRQVPPPGTLQRLGATVLRTALFVLFAYLLTGASWQLWIGAALFVAPQILAVYQERFPNSPGLFAVQPKGLVLLVVMLFVATAIGALLLRTMDEHAETFLANSFVILSLPGFLLALLSVFGREGRQPPLGWGKRIAGIAILAVGILIALGVMRDLIN